MGILSGNNAKMGNFVSLRKTQLVHLMYGTNNKIETSMHSSKMRTACRFTMLRGVLPLLGRHPRADISLGRHPLYHTPLLNHTLLYTIQRLYTSSVPHPLVDRMNDTHP